MATCVFCNHCFQPPRGKSSFSLTNCGHVFCDACLGQGKNECLICKVPCHTILLSKHTSSDVQTLFMSIDSLCKKYSQETSQISEFQEKHRRRLLAFYREKISQLEVSLRKSVLQTEQLQSSRLSQQTAFDTMKNSVSTKPNGYVLLPPNSSALERVESMEVDLTPPVQKPEVAAGPARISLISPPQDGRMGIISRGTQHPSLTPNHARVGKALRVLPQQMPMTSRRPVPASQVPGRAFPGATPSLGSAWPPPPRPPISISGLLQRQGTGSAAPGPLTHGR
ncbi:probable E3 SUMO-protein ligase RNF212 isoform X1 [Dipodomys merriami]|uniref:probable E3 SUMO-protein ligase RNF212 isoform X1 n=1 Tax=Dipodomys merriami TaxID=94247 RepID=UPI003855FADA